MILLDALYINNGGGKVLLDYLIKELESKRILVFYLFDKRTEGEFDFIDVSRRVYLKASIYGRYKFYKKNIAQYRKVFCFGNVPPIRKLRTVVVTYFHQPNFLIQPKDLPFSDRVIYTFKTMFLKSITRNTDFWIVQSKYIKTSLEARFGVKSEKVLVIPFFPNIVPTDVEMIRDKMTYLYVSNASSHKNHIRLLEAFSRFSDKFPDARLIITIGDENLNVISLLREKVDLGHKIENLGFIDRNRLIEIYQSSTFFIFPSLNESFGLGLIEALECGCKIIAADLPYTYEVCTPSLVFDPNNVESIVNAFEQSLNYNTKPSFPLIKNEIQTLINLIAE